MKILKILKMFAKMYTDPFTYKKNPIRYLTVYPPFISKQLRIVQ